jgi:predicted small lipoprotein YifL
MRSTVIILAVLLTLFSVTGCGFVADGPFGWAYTDSKMPVAIGPAKTGTKEGKACINSFFGAITVGDASIEAAMKAAGIKEIYTINKTNLNIFGTYTRQCTVVTGE